MPSRQWSLSKVWKLLKAARSEVSLHYSLFNELMEYEKALFGLETSTVTHFDNYVPV